MSTSANPPTSNPDPKNENPGMVTSDSLAAESINEGGSFAANADARGPMAQPSRSVNTNTTDTSGATVLDAAPDAEARRVGEEWGENKALNAGGELGGQGSSGQPSASSAAMAAGGPTSSTTSGSVEDRAQPKGQNITEGGFDADAPNASYTGDIGGKNDPGRAALGKFEAENVPVAGSAGERQQKVTGEGQFGSLGGDASA